MVPESRFDRTDWIAFALAAMLVIWQVFLPPPIGLANNGDFAKVMGKFSLRVDLAESEAYFKYAGTHYVIDPKYDWDPGFYNSEALLALIAVTAGRAWRGNGVFDIRFLGAIHAGLYLLAFGLALPLFHSFRAWPRRILIGLAILIFGDIMYAEYYNSFYTDAASLVFFFCAAVFFLRGKYSPPNRYRAAPFFLLCSCLFLLSKAQHAPLVVPLVLLAFSDSALVWPSRPILSRILAAGALAASGVFSFSSTPAGYSDPALFNVIFTAVLPSGQEPSTDLRELGLDDSYLRFHGIGAYKKGSPLLSTKESSYPFPGRTSYLKLSAFYLRHPVRTLQVLGLGLDQATYQRQFNLGNYAKSAGHPPDAKSYAFSLWSDLKLSVFADHGWFYLLYYLGSMAVIIRRNMIFGLVLGLTAGLALAVGALADAAETTRHLLIFNHLLDLSVLFAAASLLGSRRRDST